jgi:hypothetical protein
MPLAQLVRLLIARIHNRASQPKTPPICVDCTCAHVQSATNGRRAIFCTFGGGVRPMKLDVQYCTDYRDRQPQVEERRVGFVMEITPAEAKPAMAAKA